MIDALNDAILSGLKGAFIHNDRLTILKGLTPAIARKKALGFDHSCWDLLYHTVIWNDIFIGNIKGNLENWSPSNNWPSPDEKKNDHEFDTLVQRFEVNLQEVKNLLTSSPLDFNLKRKLNQEENFELSTVKLFITILQHISYHIGQIACVRRMVDDSPPSNR